MDETAFFRKWSNLPKSSDLNAEAWLDIDPRDLIQVGYAETVDFTPTQVQSAVGSETTGQSINDALAQTAVGPLDGMIVRSCTPSPMPLPRHWVTLHPLQEWEGYIVNKGETEFVARLRDLTAESFASEANEGIEEEAIIPLSEIADEDFNRIQPGSVFRWVIGYERAASGTKKRISQIIFRNLPSITERDKSEGIEWAKKITQALKE